MTTKAEMAGTVDRLMDLAGHIEIIKHVAGQVHLRIKPSGILLALNLNLAGLQVSLSGILGVQADTSSRTVVINYDEEVIPKEMWELLVRSHSNPKIQRLIRQELMSRISR